MLGNVGGKIGRDKKWGKNEEYSTEKKCKVWLVGYARRLPKVWQRVQRQIFLQFFPKRRFVGELENGESVGFLELPWTESEFRRQDKAWQRKKLRLALRILLKAEACRIGLPLALYEELEGELPPQVVDGRESAARAFVRQVDKKMSGRGGVNGRQVALLGVEQGAEGQEFLQKIVIEELLSRGAQPVLSGSGAAAQAEWYWRNRGIALPVLGARKAIRSSSVLILLTSGQAEISKLNGKLFVFREPMVHVPGRFSGEFAFGMFPAGSAAALLQDYSGDLQISAQ
jgi:hypothetical protein